MGGCTSKKRQTIMGSFRDMNQKVVKVIMLSKKDIRKNQEFSGLVEDYFDNCLKTLDFCSALEKCLKRARNSQLLICVALRKFEESGVEGGNNYTRTLEELKSYKVAENPFTEEFFQIFQSVYEHQIQMLEKLQSRKSKLDKKLKRFRSLRMVSRMIFATLLAAVLISSVVAAAIAAPPVAGALAAATAIPIGVMGKLVDSPLKKCEDAIKRLHNIINSTEVRTSVAIKDLGTISMLINKLEIEIESLLNKEDFTTNEDGAKICIEDIRRKVDFFLKDVDDLGVQADICSSDIQRARILILQRIMNDG
nr:UPF0496 protein At4g34320-like [Ipomoea batatas]